MATTAQLDLSIWRNDDVYEFPLRVIGPNLSGVSMRAQFRLAPDTPGVPALGLGNVSNGNAEGIRLAGVTQVDGRNVNDVRIRINKSSRQALPYSGEVGDSAPLAWAMQIGGRTRLAGIARILAHTIDSDGAPTSRPPSYESSSRNSFPNGGATLTIAEDDVVEIVLDGADFADTAAQAAQASAISASESAAAAALAAASATAVGRYFATRAAGEAASSTGQFFSTSLNGTIVYYAKTAGGSIEVGRALTQAVLPVLLVDTFPSARAAYDALPPGGGTLLCGAKRYDSLTPTSSQRLTKPNVRIVGAGRPKIKATRSRFEDGSGTIINGPLYFWGDNFEITDCAIDSGADVCSATHEGVAQDGLMSFKLDQIAWNETASPNSKGLTVRNVGALCQSPGAPVHAMLLEAYDHADVSNVEVTYGLHGFVGKLRHSNVRGVRAYGNAGGGAGEGEGFLLKGNAYAPLESVNATGIVVEGSAFPYDNGIGIQVLAEGAPGSGQVSVSDYKIVGKNVGIDIAGGTPADITIATGKIERGATAIRYSGSALRCGVSGATISNVATAVLAGAGGDLSNSLTDCKVTNVSSSEAVKIDGKLNVDVIHFEGVLASGSVCIRVGTNGGARIGKVTAKNGTILGFMNSTPNLLNGWHPTADDIPAADDKTNPFFVLMIDGRISFFGTITIGTNDQFATLPRWLWPANNVYIAITCFDGSNFVSRVLIIQPNGICRVVGAAAMGAGSFACLDGASFGDALVAA
jgi:hypothetical protein